MSFMKTQRLEWDIKSLASFGMSVRDNEATQITMLALNGSKPDFKF